MNSQNRQTKNSLQRHMTQLTIFGMYRAGPGVWPTIVLAAFLLAGPASRAAEAGLPPLTTVSKNPRLPGKFIWADLVTDDVARARSFYGQLFGWQFFSVGGYVIGMNDSYPMCGMFQKERPTNDAKAKPRWIGYISVSDVGKAEKSAKKAGGRTVIPKQNFPKRGEQAVLADPEGALFGVMRSSGGDPEDSLAGPGDWIWMQLLSLDAQKAGQFYGAVGGYDVVENTVSDRLNDYVLVSKGFARATIRRLAVRREEVNPTWLPYVRVENVDETVTKARQLGGKVLVEPKPELLGGKVAVIADPGGATFGILSWLPEVKKGDR
jgi:predicted enzyme related to lactoylglutathione lyase